MRPRSVLSEIEELVVKRDSEDYGETMNDSKMMDKFIIKCRQRDPNQSRAQIIPINAMSILKLPLLAAL